MKRCLLTALIITCAFFQLVTAQKSNIEQLTNDVIQSLTENNLIQAKAGLKKLLTTAPQNATVHTLAGIIADRENNLVEAEKHFSLAAKLAPKSAETHNNYGAILVRLNRQKLAAKEFTASLTINPNQPSALVNLAQINFSEGSLTTARELFNKAAKIQPDTEILRSLVLISLQLNDKAQATTEFPKFSALLKNSPATTFESEIALGKALSKNGLFAEAKELFEIILAKNPDQIEGLVQLSKVFLQLKKLPEAGRLLESVVARGVTNAKIYFALAEVYQSGKYFENAIPAMRLAIETDKTNESYRYAYGMLLVESKAPQAAIIRLKEYVAEFPNSAQLWFGLGAAQFHQSELVDAEQSLQKSLSINPKLIPAFAYLAAIKNISGQAGEAAKFYETALAIDEKNAIIHFLLADTLLKDATADKLKIENHLKRSIQLDDTIAAAHLDLGRHYAREKKFAEAAVELEKTVALDPKQAEAFYQLGQVYARLKRSDESKSMLAKFKILSEQGKEQTKSDYSDLVRRLAKVNF